MPDRPPAPNPAPPRTYGPDFAQAMHRWAYPLHHDCGHYRGFRSTKPTRCLNCIKDDRRKARRRLAGVALACLIAFGLTLIGCCAAGGVS